MSDLEPGLDIAAAIRQLDRRLVVPPIDPAREMELLAAFDADWHARSDRSPETPIHRPRWRMWGAALAPIATAAAITGLWIATGIPPRHELPAPPPVLPSRADPGAFVLWPGAASLPSFESGELVRMELPSTLLPSLGLRPPPNAAAVVTADVVVGQDGLARAVRLVP
jgi:hypothetical protein